MVLARFRASISRTDFYNPLFFDAVGLGKLSLLSGVGELLGNLVSAFLLIPRFGNIGRSISYPLGWFLAVLSLSIAYLYSRKKIYGPAVKKA